VNLTGFTFRRPGSVLPLELAAACAEHEPIVSCSVLVCPVSSPCGLKGVSMTRCSDTYTVSSEKRIISQCTLSAFPIDVALRPKSRPASLFGPVPSSYGQDGLQKTCIRAVSLSLISLGLTSIVVCNSRPVRMTERHVSWDQGSRFRVALMVRQQTHGFSVEIRK
jgi:hypothetical protein